MRVSGLWIPNWFFDDFLKPTVLIPTNLLRMTKPQQRVYRELIRTTSEKRLSRLISETAGARGIPNWRCLWPEGFDRDVLNACERDVGLVEDVIILMAAARCGEVLTPTAVQVEFSDERPDESKRARFCEGFLLARAGGLAVWVSGPEEVFLLFSKRRCQRAGRGPAEIARAVSGVDLHILSTGAACCFNLNGPSVLEEIDRAFLKSARRGAALTKRKKTVKAISEESSLSSARIYQLRKARGLAGPKSIEIEKRRRRVAELRADGMSQREIAKRLRITHRQVRQVWESEE